MSYRRSLNVAFECEKVADWSRNLVWEFTYKSFSTFIKFSHFKLDIL